MSLLEVLMLHLVLGRVTLGNTNPSRVESTPRKFSFAALSLLLRYGFRAKDSSSISFAKKCSFLRHMHRYLFYAIVSVFFSIFIALFHSYTLQIEPKRCV